MKLFKAAIVRHKGMSIAVVIPVALATLLLVASGAAAAIPVNFTAPATATPPTVNVAQPNPTVSVIPDTLGLAGNNGFTQAQWNTALTTTLTKQGFVGANNWVFAFNGLPAGITNPVSLGTGANFNVTQYSLSVTPAQPGGQISEPVKFTINLGSTNVPAGATAHWLQLLDSDKRYGTDEANGNPFGYQINGLPGYWGLDNGDLAVGDKAGVGPYYDSNSGPAYSANFSDTPTVGRATPGTYLHFLTIPSWNLTSGGKNYILIGNYGLSWGYTVTPEPWTFWLMAGGCLLMLLRRRRAA